MNLRLKFTIATIFFVLLAGFFVLAIPSLIGFLLACLVTLAIYDIVWRRERLATRTFNFALRAACHQQGNLSKIAAAFARYGPLRAHCYEYARRLMVGEDPVRAAAASRLQLQLSTAVAIRTSAELPVNSAMARDERDWGVRETDSLPAYSQILYLTLAATITCVVLSYVTVSVLPDIERMFSEFALSMESYEWLIAGTTPAWIAVTVVVLLLLLMIPILASTDHFTTRILKWLPLSPRAAQSRADILEGLADATDAGMPFSNAIALAAEISINPDERWSFQNAFRSIEQGAAAADALYQNGWINGEEVSWLGDTPPHRFAQLLRYFGQQGVRDARANLQWLMGIIFPLLVVLLGFAVLTFAYGFLGTILNLIVSLA